MISLISPDVQFSAGSRNYSLIFFTFLIEKLTFFHSVIMPTYRNLHDMTSLLLMPKKMHIDDIHIMSGGWYNLLVNKL